MSLIIPSTSKTVMRNTTPPVGWTKDTSYNEYTLRCVTGSTTSGGTVNFSSVFSNFSGPPISSTSISVSEHTLTSGQLATHNHNRLGSPQTTGTRQGTNTAVSPQFASSSTTFFNIDPIGGGGSHSHPIGSISSSSNVNGGFDFRVKYVDTIIVTRN